MADTIAAEAAQAEATTAPFVPDIILHKFPSGQQCLATTAQSIADCVGIRHGEILRMARTIYTPHSDGAFLASNVEFIHGTGTRIRGIIFSHIGCGNFLLRAGSRSRNQGPAYEAASETFDKAFRDAATGVADVSATAWTGAVLPAMACVGKPKAKAKAKAKGEPELKVQQLPIDEPTEEKLEEKADPAPAEAEPAIEEAKPEEEAKAEVTASEREQDGGPDALRGAPWLAPSRSCRPCHTALLHSPRVDEVRELTTFLEFKGFEPRQAASIALDNVYGWATRPIGGSRPYRP